MGLLIVTNLGAPLASGGSIALALAVAAAALGSQSTPGCREYA